MCVIVASRQGHWRRQRNLLILALIVHCATLISRHAETQQAASVLANATPIPASGAGVADDSSRDKVAPDALPNGTAACSPELIDALARRCATFNGERPSARSLDNYLEFFATFELFRRQCVSSAQLEDDQQQRQQDMQLAEEQCDTMGFNFGQMQQLAHLIGRLRANESVCNIEFTMKLYHLHAQLAQQQQVETVVGLGRVFRLFANSVALKCRLSLAARLADVERRAPDSVRHLALINGIAFHKPEQLARMALAQAELYVPILERELPLHLFDLETQSLGRGLGGAQFESRKLMGLALDGLRLSCKALKLYQVNLLGSLGLLASLGYASPLEIHGAGRDPHAAALRDSSEQSQLVSRWLLGALLCQSARNIIKMSSASSAPAPAQQQQADGRPPLPLLLVGPAQEPEVALAEEHEKLFDSMRLPELQFAANLTSFARLLHGARNYPPPTNDSTITEEANLIAGALSEFKFNGTTAAAVASNSRKLQLMNGPSYRLARAIVNYLDVSQQQEQPVARRRATIELAIGAKFSPEPAH